MKLKHKVELQLGSLWQHGYVGEWKQAFSHESCLHNWMKPNHRFIRAFVVKKKTHLHLIKWGHSETVRYIPWANFFLVLVMVLCVQLWLHTWRKHKTKMRMPPPRLTLVCLFLSNINHWSGMHDIINNACLCCMLQDQIKFKRVGPSRLNITWATTSLRKRGVSISCFIWREHNQRFTLEVKI